MSLAHPENPAIKSTMESLRNQVIGYFGIDPTLGEAQWGRKDAPK